MNNTFCILFHLKCINIKLVFYLHNILDYKYRNLFYCSCRCFYCVNRFFFFSLRQNITLKLLMKTVLTCTLFFLPQLTCLRFIASLSLVSLMGLCGSVPYLWHMLEAVVSNSAMRLERSPTETVCVCSYIF